MSTPSSGPSRRRRIAGERRGPGTPTDAPTDARADAPVTAPHPPTRAEPAPAVEQAPPHRRRRPARATGERRGSRGLLGGLAALLVLLLAYSGLLLMGWLGNDSLEDVSRADDEAAAARSAQASAERAAEAVLAYDFRSLEADRDAATRFMTDEYAEQYVATFDAGVTKAAENTRAQVAVEVKGSSVVTTGTDEVKVLLFLDQTTLRSDTAQPRQTLNRTEFRMVREGDSWLVADILAF